MKIKRADSIFSIVAAVIMLASLIITEVSFQTAQGWFDDEAVNVYIIALAVLSMGLMIGYLVITIRGIKAKNNLFKVIKDVLAAAGAACMGVIAGLTIGAIATEFAYTFLSDFNTGTAKAEFMPTACIQAGVGIVLALVAILIVTIGGFIKEE